MPPTKKKTSAAASGAKPKHVKGVPRNYLLPGGVERYGRSAMYRMKGMYKRKQGAVKVAKATLPATKSVPIGGAKNGGTRTLPRVKPPRYTLAEVLSESRHRSRKPKPAKLRASLTPGTVVILVAGPYRGKRVVFLKQLESGLLLVTGPYGINKVPVRRVNQAYVIATTTKVDVTKVDTTKFTDAYFVKASKEDKKKKEFFEKEGEAAKTSKIPASDARKEDQKNLDTPIIAAFNAVPNMAAYVASTFSLEKGQYPHSLKF